MDLQDYGLFAVVFSLRLVLLLGLNDSHTPSPRKKD